MTPTPPSAVELLLTLVEPGPSPAGGRSRRLRSGQLTVGRAAPADWVLEDSQRLMSKLHCRFEVRGRRFTVTDTSTNGLFVNGAESALGNGNSVELATGDVLTLGDYTLRVTIADERPAAGLASPLDALGADSEWLPPRSEASADAIAGNDLAMDSSWLRPPVGDQRPPQSEFFQPPQVERSGIPDDWFLDGGECAAEAPPPAATSLSPRLPGAVSAEVAIGEVRDHVAALHAAVAALLDWLPPDQAAEAVRVFQSTYAAARFR